MTAPTSSTAERMPQRDSSPDQRRVSRSPAAGDANACWWGENGTSTGRKRPRRAPRSPNRYRGARRRPRSPWWSGFFWALAYWRSRGGSGRSEGVRSSRRDGWPCSTRSTSRRDRARLLRPAVGPGWRRCRHGHRSEPGTRDNRPHPGALLCPGVSQLSDGAGLRDAGAGSSTGETGRPEQLACAPPGPGGHRGVRRGRARASRMRRALGRDTPATAAAPGWTAHAPGWAGDSRDDLVEACG